MNFRIRNLNQMSETESDYFSKARVETFSDGIFAIIVTLLVLELQVPEIENHNSIDELLTALIHLLPKIFSWMVSFLIVCVIWVNHHRMFEQLKIVTHGFFWLNANLMLWCSFIPFPTALMGDYVNNPISLFTFGIILALMAFSFYLMRLNILKNNYVLKENIDLAQYKVATKKSLVFGPMLYSIGAACSFIHPYLAFAMYFFIPLYFIFYNSSKTK